MSNITNFVGDWEPFLVDIFANREVIQGLNVINGLYINNTRNIGPKIYPDQQNVFKAFKECSYKSLSAIIVLQDPYHDGSATGIALANNVNTAKLSPSLRVVKDTISKTMFNGHDFDFDPTLLKWEKQGILMLNTALTVEAGKPNSHSFFWKPFMQAFFKKISIYNSGINICFWGNAALQYIGYANSQLNNIYYAEHPATAVYKNIEWQCDHFKLLSDNLKRFNNITIDW